MEVNNITMTGLGRAISDLDAKDGELSVSHNIINDNGAMRPIWVPEDVMTLQDGEELAYVHRTSAYKNYIVGGRIRVTNQITVYHKYGKEYPDNYLRLIVVLQYPAASDLKIYLKCLIAGSEEERIVTFPEGTLGKQTLAMGEQDTFIEARFEAQDGHYNYVLSEVDDSNDVSDNATWDENPPEFLYGLNFFTDEDPKRKEVIEFPSEDYRIKFASIGNTLILTSERGLEYVLYKDGSYKPLGQKPPELDVSWRLTNMKRFSSKAAEVLVTAPGNEGRTTFDDEVQAEVGVQIAAEVNRLIAEAEEENWFTSTFFVRWAYRMYNGLYMASPPVMMPLNAGVAPVMNAFHAEEREELGNDPLTEFHLVVQGFQAKLEYMIPFFLSRKKKLLDEWSDIIDGVEIYVTRGISRFDADGKPEKIVENNGEERCITYGRMMAGLGSGSTLYARKAYKQTSGYRIDGMQKTDTDYLNELKSNGIFYRLKSYKLDELGESGVVEPEEGAIKNLATAPVMSDETDEYLEHDKLFVDGVHVYNSRLNLYGVKSQKYNFPLMGLMAYTDGYMDEESDEVRNGYQYGIRFFMGSEGEKVTVTHYEANYRLYEPPLWLFYPDNSVKRVIVERYNTDEGSWQHAEMVMSSHPTLQGGYWFNGFERLDFKNVTEEERLTLETEEERRVSNEGKIYTSEVNNPFVFPLGGINTIGTGKIVGVSTVTKALSQGQFGQFPLYVFSTEGVWAMEVGDNGLYSSVKPVSRDVCINGDSITQTDDAVLFVTEQGVMFLDGSSVVCISDMMNGRNLDVDSIYGLAGLMKDGIDDPIDFVDYARTARMAYDYANNRILLYRDDMAYCYVFSMTSSTWATLGMEIENAVSDYPDVYVQNGSGVKNLSTRADYDSEEMVDTLIVTRPVKLGSDGFKTIYEMIARGSMNRNEGALFLWGSHDGMEYVLIKSVYGNRIYRTGGTGYRYFRLGVVGKMNVGETLSMISVGFVPKYQNRLR